ncbi:MAG: hypothetical protein ACTSPD_16950 [Promethearchaeota archaeon]
MPEKPILSELIDKIKLMATNSKSEDDFKIGLEEIFKEYFRKLNINIHFKQIKLFIKTI